MTSSIHYSYHKISKFKFIKIIVPVNFAVCTTFLLFSLSQNEYIRLFKNKLTTR